LAQAVRSRKTRRPPNEVDKLVQSITEIQASCEHSYRLDKPFELYETNVPGVMAHGNAHYDVTMDVVCLSCNVSAQLSVGQHCPSCIGPMRAGSPQEGGHSKYFGLENGWGIHADVQVDCCTQCGLKLVREIPDLGD
jgi:hypothetical protein